MTYTEAPCDLEPDRIERDFWAFHIANPRVYLELRDHALHLRRKGRLLSSASRRLHLSLFGHMVGIIALAKLIFHLGW